MLRSNNIYAHAFLVHFQNESYTSQLLKHGVHLIVTIRYDCCDRPKAVNHCDR